MINNDVVPSIADLEAASHASHALSPEPARTDANDDVPISTNDVVLNEESQPWSGKLAIAADDEANIETEGGPTSGREENGDVTDGEVKPDVKKLVTNKIVTVVREVQDNFLRETFH